MAVKHANVPDSRHLNQLYEQPEGKVLLHREISWVLGIKEAGMAGQELGRILGLQVEVFGPKGFLST